MVSLGFGLLLFGPLFEGVASVSKVGPVIVIRLVGLERFFKHDSCKLMELSFFGCESGEPLVHESGGWCFLLRRHGVGGSTVECEGNFGSTFPFRRSRWKLSRMTACFTFEA